MFSFHKDFATLTRAEKLFILFAMLTGFCIYSEYAIVRPASQSIFLEVFSARAYPAIWLATVPLNFAVIYLYNHFLPRFGPLRMMTAVAAIVVVIHLICGFLLPTFPHLIFFHFCWKDIYIRLMFQQLWSMIHSTISAQRAKYIYGMIFGVGTCGGILGSLVPGLLATKLGSTQLFFFTVPIYSLLLFVYIKAYRLSGAVNLIASIEPDQTKARDGFLLIIRNRYLLAELCCITDTNDLFYICG